MADEQLPLKPLETIDATTQFAATKVIGGVRKVVQIAQSDLRGLDGKSAIATITNATPAPIPAVGQQATYGVDSSGGFAIDQIVAIGSASTLKVVGTPTATSIAIENVDATPGAVAVGAKIVPSGKRGPAGSVLHVTAAPLSTQGNQDDTAIRSDGQIYKKTDATTWTLTADLLTKAEGDALYSPIGGDAQGGLRYNLSLTATSPPASGQVRFNNTAISSVTQLFIHESDRNTAAQSDVLDAIALGTRIQVIQEDNEEVYAWFRVTGAPVDNGTDRTIPVAFVSSSGTFVAGEVSVFPLQIQATDPNAAKLNAVNAFARAQGVAPAALVDAATIATDATLSNAFTVTLGGNRTLGAPTGLQEGFAYDWFLVQDATGSRTISFAAIFDFGSASPPILSTPSSSITWLSFKFILGKLRFAGDRGGFL